VIAGGTEIVPRWIDGRLDFDRLVDLRGLALDRIVATGSEIRIGALATFSSLLASDLVSTRLPSIAACAAAVGAAQTRTLATIGGNLSAGVPSMDAGPPLLVLDAALQLVSLRGTRKVPVEDFFIGPRQTALEPDEILTEIVVALPRDDFGSSFLKIGRRRAMTLAVVNAAAGIRVDAAGEIVEAKLALGAVAPTPLRARSTERQLLGSRIGVQVLRRAAETAAQEIAPISDLRASASYRRQVSEVLAVRALTAAWRRTAAEGGEDVV
jgi:carbon-monoxide dehydrogenase medium subunit